MPDEQKKIRLTYVIAAMMAMCAVAALLLAFNYWLLVSAQRNFNDKLAALDAKFAAVDANIDKGHKDLLFAVNRLPSLDATTKALDAKIEKSRKDLLIAINGLRSLDATAEKIETLNSGIKKVNETLAEIQRQISPAAAKAELAPLDKKLDKANTALDAMKLDDAARNSALARIEKAIDAVRHGIADTASQIKLQDATEKLDAARASLAKIEKATNSLAKIEKAAGSLATIEKTADALKTDVTANASALNDARKSLTELKTAVKDGFAGGASVRTELRTAITKLFQPPPPAPPPAPTPAKAAPIPPMSVQFERTGSFEDHGPIDLIIQKLSRALKGRSGCAIDVEGYTDTVGSDRANHALSKKRALEIAAKLKAALADKTIQISTTAWGERRLKEWTQDNVDDATNRRVDIVVHCSDG